MVANPARGQLNREKLYFPIPGRASEFGLARQVWPYHPASACSFPILRMPPDFRGVVVFNCFVKPPTTIGSVPSLLHNHCVLMAFAVESPPAQGQQ